MWNIIATVLNNAACSKASAAPYSVAEHIVAGVIALITWREAHSMRAVRVKSPLYTRRLSTSAKVRAARGKNDTNIEEMIADGRFGIHAKV